MKNSLTFRTLDYQVLKQCRLVANDIPGNARQSYINQALMKIYAYLEALNDPFYNFVAPLTVVADQERLESANITAIDATAKTITRGDATAFVAGSIVYAAIFNTVALTWTKWWGRITVGGEIGTYVVISGADGNYTGVNQEVTVGVKKTLSTTTVDLSDLYIKEINRVWDGNAGSEREYFLVEDGRAIGDMQNDPDFDAEVMAYHRGVTLELKKGASASAIGSVQMEYRGKPNEYTDATANNAILLPPEFNAMLFDEVKGMYQMHKNGSVEEGLQKQLANYAKMYEAAAAQRNVEVEKKGKVSK